MVTARERNIGAPGSTTRQVTMALRRIIRAIELHSRILVQRYGLTGPQLELLKELTEGEARTVGELARAASLSQPTVTGILDRLERKGLAHRSRSTGDRRKVLVSPTPAAQRVLEGAPPLLQEHFEERFAELADWEQTLILASLQRIVALMEADEVRAGPILSTGPLSVSSEQTTAFLNPSRNGGGAR